MKKYIKVFTIILVSTLLGMAISRSTMADCKTGNGNNTAAAKPATENQKLVKENQEINDNTYYISAKQAHQLIEQNPQTAILAVAYGKYPNFNKGHIPGAIQMSTNEVESQKNHWNILPASQLRKNFLKKGITADTPVIFYSNDISAASRVAFAAYWLGVKNIKIIDGGQQAWTRAGYKLQKGNEAKIKAQTDFGSNTVAHPEALIKTPKELLAAESANPNLVLVSTRSWKEYLGNISGYSYIKETGEVKGAVYGRISKSSSDVAYLTNDDGTIKNPTAELEYWKKKGIVPDKEVVFYCGTGWRACVPFFIAKEEGFQNVKVYDGGWYDWNMSHKTNPEKFPVQKGEPGTSNFRIEKGAVAER